MLDAFADLLGVMLVLTDLHGDPITEVSNHSPFYSLLEERSGAASLFHDSWGDLALTPVIGPRWVPAFSDLLCARAKHPRKSE